MKTCPERLKLLDCGGHALVTGGPGSGKTTLALMKAAARIEAGLLPGQRVLFLSFSRNAVSRVLQVSRLQLSRQGRAALNVQTFHSFFWDLLKTHGYLLGAPSPLRVLMPQDERVRNGGIKKDLDSQEWIAWLSERDKLFTTDGLVAFDLFAPKAADLLGRSPWILRLACEMFPLVIVDEAQDTGPDAWRCVELIASRSQVICLADMEQQIFDHLPGIGPERLDAIRETLKPLEVSLGAENLRSPGSQIAEFGRDIIACRVSIGGYKGVSSISFGRGGDLANTLRVALGSLYRQVRKETGKKAVTVAILVPSAKDAWKVSAALNQGLKPVPHKLLFDEDEARLAARFAAFLLEPKEGKSTQGQLAEGLSLLADLRRAANAMSDAAKIAGWAKNCAGGRASNAGLVRAVKDLLDTLRTSSFVGDPARDWNRVKETLRHSGQPLLERIAGHLDYLVAFNRGKHISSGLNGTWEATASYRNAREVLDNALLQDLIVDGVDDPDGIQVMTIHKSKGKQFEGVIVVRGERHDGNRLVFKFYLARRQATAPPKPKDSNGWRDPGSGSRPHAAAGLAAVSAHGSLQPVAT